MRFCRGHARRLTAEQWDQHYKCPGCGGKKSKGSAVCQQCENEVRSWSKEAIIEAIQEWAEKHDGEPPRANDWKGDCACPNDGYVKDKGRYPCSAQVQKYFGSWNKGLKAAGFPPRSRGSNNLGRLTMEDLGETVRLVEDIGITRAAARLGMTVSGVARRRWRYEDILAGRTQPRRDGCGRPLTEERKHE